MQIFFSNCNQWLIYTVNIKSGFCRSGHTWSLNPSTLMYGSYTSSCKKCDQSKLKPYTLLEPQNQQNLKPYHYKTYIFSKRYSHTCCMNEIYSLETVLCTRPIFLERFITDLPQPIETDKRLIAVAYNTHFKVWYLQETPSEWYICVSKKSYNMCALYCIAYMQAWNSLLLSLTQPWKINVRLITFKTHNTVMNICYN